jgi:hypothetical protein
MGIVTQTALDRLAGMMIGTGSVVGSGRGMNV